MLTCHMCYVMQQNIIPPNKYLKEHAFKIA